MLKDEFLRGLVILTVVAGVFTALTWGSERWYSWIPDTVTVLLVLGCFWRLDDRDDRISWLVRRPLARPDELATFERSLPSFRLLDAVLAAETWTKEQGGFERLAKGSSADLDAVIRDDFSKSRGNSRATTPSNVSLACGPGQRRFVATDTIWRRDDEHGAADVAVVRVCRPPYSSGKTRLELAARSRGAAEEAFSELMRLLDELSVYRGHVLELGVRGREGDGFEDDDSPDLFTLRFLEPTAIGRDDIVLEDDIVELLESTVVDFHRRRDLLRSVGLSGRRGLLFHGPPGTGKTFTTKYLAGRLESATTLVVVGSALAHVRAACQTARALQPSLIVLEDVDLAFAQRELNPHSAPLGELMDELDGFAGADDVLFVLTTNAVERVEEAIRDRPGRISQCVEFPLPGPALRETYLRVALRPFDASALDLDRAVELTHGCTQAFMKELVARSVQLAISASEDPEGVRDRPERVGVTTEALERALSQMRDGASASAASILGFARSD